MANKKFIVSIDIDESEEEYLKADKLGAGDFEQLVIEALESADFVVELVEVRNTV